MINYDIEDMGFGLIDRTVITYYAGEISSIFVKRGKTILSNY